MAYNGTTAASSVANPPVRLWGTLMGGLNTASTVGTGGGAWLYQSTNGTTELISTTFFTDAYYLGMKQGDLVFYAGSTGSSAYCGFGILGAVTTSGAGLSSTNGTLSSTR